MTRYHQFFFVLFFAALLPVVCGGFATAEIEPASVSANGVKIARIELGINGVYKTGCWVPCRVFFDGILPPDAHVTVIALDPDGTPARFTADMDRSSAQPVATALVRLGRDNGTLTVRVETGVSPGDASNRRFLAERVFSPRETAASSSRSGQVDQSSGGSGFFPKPVPNEQPIYLVFAADDLGIESAFAHMAFRDNNRPLVVSPASLHDLPNDPVALEMVSTVVLAGDPALYEGIAPDHAGLSALKRWLHLGGRIVFNAGRDSEPLVSGDDALFADFLPGKFERMASLRLSSPYEVYISQFRHTSVTPIHMTGGDDAPFVETPFFSEPRGIVEASDGDLALIVRVPMGLGSLVYMGGDLDRAPISKWRDRPVLVAKLLGASERTSHQERHEGHSLMQLGYNDFSGQLRSALDRFENVRGISFSFIMILLAVYLVAVGIGDWLLIHKLLKRPQLTWVTFPCWVILFCLIAVVISRRTQVDDVIVNQTELIDIDAATGTARGTAWFGVYSPRDAAYDLRFAADSNARNPNTRFAWFGLPGSALGGMSPRTVSLAQWDAAYALGSPADRIDDLPMQTRSTRSLTAAWETTHYDNMPVVAELVEQEGIPCGYVMNVSPRDLEQCFVVYGRWVIELNEVKAGAAIEVSTATKRRDLRTAFSGGRSIFSEERSFSRVASGRYNAESTNVPYILRSMMFYEAAGGFDEFSLYNAYQDSVDLSNLLPTRRAMLIALVSEPENAETSNPATDVPIFGSVLGSQILRTTNGVEQPLEIAKRNTFLRMILPVQNDGRGDR